MKKIKIHFLYLISSYWTSWRSFYEACEMHPDIEVKIILLDVSNNNSKVVSDHISQLKNQIKFLESNLLSYTKYEDYSLEKESPDILVYSSPYDFYYESLFPKFNTDNIKKQGIKMIYIPYGIEYDKDIFNNNFLRKIQTRQKIHENAWKIFVMNDDIKNSFKDHPITKGKNVVAIGAPKFDIYRNKENISLSEDIRKKAQNRKIVMYQIHIPNNNNVVLKKRRINRFHTLNFKEHIQVISQLNKFKDYYFIITIHPLFKTVAIDRLNLVKEAQYQYFIRKIQENENCLIYNSDNYQSLIANADAFITENSSLMIEMAFFDKPVLYLYDVPVSMKNFANDIVSTFYQGSKATDVFNYLSYEIKEDVLNYDRKDMQRKIFKNYDGRIGERILEYIIANIWN